MGLSFTYAGSNRMDIVENIIPIILDLNNSMELSSIAAMVCGLIFISSTNEDIITSILEMLM
jgi:26S proteasome regulatory subunit N1